MSAPAPDSMLDMPPSWTSVVQGRLEARAGLETSFTVRSLGVGGGGSLACLCPGFPHLDEVAEREPPAGGAVGR